MGSRGAHIGAFAPALRERFGWRSSLDAGIAVPGSRVAMARAAAWFSAVATLVALVAIAVPHNPDMDERGLAAVAVGTALLAAVALAGFDRLPGWTFAAGAGVATLLAALTVDFWGMDSYFGPLPFLFPTLYAAWFLPRTAFRAQLALAALALGGFLVLEDPGYTPVASWIATVATLAGAGFLTALLRERLAHVIEALADAARRDPLTTLLNRRGFDEAFDTELERSRRSDQTLAVIVGDVDEFKALNDRAGHAAGDEALRGLGQAIDAAKRSWDTAARIGGEEFAIVAADTDERGAYILAERIRTSLARRFAGGPAEGVTISFGIAGYPAHGQTAEVLLKAADQALYAAKELGRDRSVISSAEIAGILDRPGRATDSTVELGTLLSLAEALDLRDSGSATHCRRVGRYSELIARELGLAPDAVERVRIAGVLHDVGRVGLPDEVLEKEGPLDDHEWQLVHEHPAIGARMLSTTAFADIGAWIGAHHERPDGQGYPDGLRSDDVPIEAAIIGVADAYEAMTSARSYRGPMDPEAASVELRRGAGRQFEEQVVDALLRVV